jgi:SAM-dependent methyltransferase
VNSFLLPNGVVYIGCYLNRLLYSYLKREYSSILDIGCGVGRQLEFFKSRGFARLAGCDININEVHYGREDIAFRVVDLDNEKLILPYTSDSFDVVLCYHVLEHLKFPDLVVKEMVRVAKEIVLIVVPAGNSYDSPEHINYWETFGDIAQAFLSPSWTFSIELTISKIADVVLQQAGFLVCIYNNSNDVNVKRLMEMNNSNTNFPMVLNLGVER